jgi:hypothetical protein
MCLAGCSRTPPPRTVGPGPINCTTTACPEQRNFVIVYGDPGLDGHNLGRLPELAARTHEREVRANTFPGVPRFTAADRITTTHISTVSALITQVAVGNVVYLAYFGHSGPIRGVGPGALFIGEGASPGSNLTNRGNSNDASPTTIPATHFRSDGQVRLFGCRGGFGNDPIAQQMADQLRIPVFAYTNSGGSLFTTDATLGHGGRAVTDADICRRRDASGHCVEQLIVPENAPNVWLIPINGTPTFRQF